MAAFRHASLLLAILTVLSCFLPAFVGAQFRSTRSRLGLRPMGPMGRRASLTNPDFFWGNGFEEQDLEEAARKLSQSTSSELWDKATFPPEDRPSYMSAGQEWTPLPKERRWMGLKEFMEASGENSTNSNVSEALFLVLSQGSGYLEKSKVDDALESWRSTDGLNQAGWGVSLFWAKAQIAFGYAWLYGMSSFCGYFFFFRPPLVIYLGIDLLPGIPQWWTS